VGNPLQPSPALLSKFGSIIVHAEEMFGPTGHHFDRTALEQLLKDPEVRAWLGEMNRMAMLPVKRTLEDLKLAAAKRRKGGK
jgi:hypothetical protein